MRNRFSMIGEDHAAVAASRRIQPICEIDDTPQKVAGVVSDGIGDSKSPTHRTSPGDRPAISARPPRRPTARRGPAAIELVAVLPCMLLLYLVAIEVGDGLSIEAKVAATAHRVTDLTSENISTDDAAIRRILKDSTAMIAPYSATPLVVTISEISTDEAGNATVTWSDSLHGTAHPAGQAVTLPPALAGQPNMSLILGEASYQFTPRFGSALTGTLTLSDRYYLFPSHSNGVARVTS